MKITNNNNYTNINDENSSNNMKNDFITLTNKSNRIYFSPITNIKNDGRNKSKTDKFFTPTEKTDKFVINSRLFLSPVPGNYDYRDELAAERGLYYHTNKNSPMRENNNNSKHNNTDKHTPLSVSYINNKGRFGGSNDATSNKFYNNDDEEIFIIKTPKNIKPYDMRKMKRRVDSTLFLSPVPGNYQRQPSSPNQ